MADLYQAVYECLLQGDINRKFPQVRRLRQQWEDGDLQRMTLPDSPPEAIATPGRPEKPLLVNPKQVKQRRLNTPTGRAILLHAVAHIEFNAVNLALDAAYRFRDMPDAYYSDWLRVAAEEAYHFGLLQQRLQRLGHDYGDFPAHNGLWEQACKTDHDVMVRMALVPRVLEARGLDVTPGMMERLQQNGDTETADILAIILQDEIEHVRIGSYWYRYCCEQRALEPESTFRQLIREIMKAPLRGPFYTQGRLQAGFTENELNQLLEMENNWVKEL